MWRAGNFSGGEVPWGAGTSPTGARTVSFSTALLSLLSSLGLRPPDLCVRSAGRSPEDTRTNGQPIRVDRKSQSAHTQTARGKGPEPASRGGGPLCPLRWAFIRSHPHRWATNACGMETPLVIQHKEIARLTAHQHRPGLFPEGELFDSPGFAAQRLPWVGDMQKRPEP